MFPFHKFDDSSLMNLWDFSCIIIYYWYENETIYISYFEEKRMITMNFLLVQLTQQYFYHSLREGPFI